MTIELFSLSLLAVFATLMWMPFIVGVTNLPQDANVNPNDFTRPVDLTKLPAWVHRAHRAHLNLIEQAVPFGIAVIVAHLVGVSNVWTSGAAIAFVLLRIVHAAGMISGWAVFPIRPIIFSLGVLCTLTIVGMTMFA